MLLGALILLFSAQPVSAVTITVSDTCTLNAAIWNANFDSVVVSGCPAGSGDDIIVVSGTVTLASALETIASNITIQGGGTIDGANTVRVLKVAGGHLTLNNMTITKGSATGDGGGIEVEWDGVASIRPTLTLSNTTVSGNAATGNGGGIYFNGGALSITNSTITNNSTSGSSSYGGGIALVTPSGVTGAKTITGSVISSNSAARGAAIWGGNASTNFTIERSAIHSNSVTGATPGYVAVIGTNNGDIVIRNSTLYGNSGTHANVSAIYALNTSPEVSLTHVTIAGNTLARGLDGFAAGATWTVYNSIIAGASGNDCNVPGGLDTKAGNLIQDNTCSPAVSGDPLLAERVSTENFFKLQTGSPAIDAGNDAQCASAGNDQRNMTRPSADCDIGAIEAAAVTVPAPTAAFTFSVNDLTASFDSSTSTGSGLTYSWEFGDVSAGTSTEASPSYTYASAGSYNVKLTVTNAGGSNSITKSVTVTDPVSAAFTYTKDGLAVTFDSSTSTGDNLTYSWNFGDSNTSSEASPTHTYASHGTYSVTLTVTSGGDSDTSAAQSVTVDVPANAAFTFSVNGLTATFDSSTSTGSNLTYSWDFGDSSAANTESDPTYTYASGGTYSVTLTVSNSDGSDTSAAQSVTVTAPPTAAFTFTKNGLAVMFDSSTSTGAGLTYSWDFGDGNSSSQASPTHTYASAGTYSVTLTVSNSGGSDTSAAQSVSVAPAPVAIFTFRVNALTATFNSSRSRGANLTYSWDFGDGNSSTEANPTHTYAAHGDYDVTLTVTNAGGSHTSAAQTVSAVQPPTAAFTFSVTGGLEVSFDSSTSTGFGLSYNWNFGDGRRSTEASPTHIYRRGGTFNVTLTVRNSAGSDTAAAQTVTVVEPPTAAFTAIRNGLRVRFESSRARGNDLTYSWDFGDGSSPTYASDRNPTHEYAAEGDYSVSLTLSNSEGTDMLTTMVTVAPGLVDRRDEPDEDEEVDDDPPGPRRTPKPTVHTGLELNADRSDGITVGAQHGLNSGIQFQRRRPDTLHVEQAANIGSVINAGVIDLIDVWGFTGQEWELCVENWRLGASGGLMFIEKLSPVGRVVHTAPGAVNTGSQTCLRMFNRAGVVALVSRTPVPARLQPEPAPAAGAITLSGCMVTLNAHLNFRESPAGRLIYILHEGITLTALERTEGWFKVDFHGERGWLAADYVTPRGNCG